MVGVDEVGRGCLAGPLLVVAARPMGALPGGLRDSKLLSRNQRSGFMDLIVKKCQFGEGWVSAPEIDSLGLSAALSLGAQRALAALKVSSIEEIIIDGKHNYLPKNFKNSQAIVGADNKIGIVSAASVYAKVRRDNYMIGLARKHTAYGFEKNVGYGTSEHLLALVNLGGLEAVHRFSFAPLRRTT